MVFRLSRKYPREAVSEAFRNDCRGYMSNRKTVWFSSFGTLVLMGLSASLDPGVRAGVHQDPQETPAQPDNTKKNLPTNHHDANRADQQSNSSTDVELTRKIRRALTQDKSLSTYAHNIKIITRDGVVELKGPVRSQSERDAVEAKATELAGNSKVKDELTVKAEK
jgi:hyperosmotically inducible periplasmic protein